MFFRSPATSHLLILRPPSRLARLNFAVIDCNFFNPIFFYALSSSFYFYPICTYTVFTFYFPIIPIFFYVLLNPLVPYLAEIQNLLIPKIFLYSSSSIPFSFLFPRLTHRILASIYSLSTFPRSNML